MSVEAQESSQRRRRHFANFTAAFVGVHESGAQVRGYTWWNLTEQTHSKQGTRAHACDEYNDGFYF
jgi:exonuclease III